MTYYVETPEMGVTILSDEVCKPFSVRPALMMTYTFTYYQTVKKLDKKTAIVVAYRFY